MNLYRIFKPQYITFEYWDDYGNQYADIVEGTPFVDRPYTEAEAMDSDQVLAVALPYLGHVGGIHTHWQPGPDLRFQNFIAAHTP